MGEAVEDFKVGDKVIFMESHEAFSRSWQMYVEVVVGVDSENLHLKFGKFKKVKFRKATYLEGICGHAIL